MIELRAVEAYEAIPTPVKAITAFILACGMVAFAWLILDALGAPV